MTLKCVFMVNVALTICLSSNLSFGIKNSAIINRVIFQVDTPDTQLPFPIKDNKDPLNEGKGSNIKLDDPSNIKTEIEYDSKSKTYQVKKNIGDNIYYQNPSYMTLDEYRKYDMKKSMDDYWKSKSSAETLNNSKAFAPKINIKGKGFDRLFGGNTVDIRPQGSAEISMGVNVAKTENPQIPENQRSIATFDLKQKIQLNVVGNIGEKLKLTTNFNTEATFDFENQIKLEYTGYEDEIIKKIEAGNVSLPLSGSLITGSQSLFGLKTELQFGKLTATTVFSQQKGQRSEINVSGGVQTNDYELKADNYEANKHFFLAHFFRNSFDKSMQSLPLISSEINITRIQVWITNTNNSTQETRNMLAFMDLGEARTYDKEIGIRVDSSSNSGGILPDNNRNNIYRAIASKQDIRGFSNATGALASMSNPGGFKQSNHYEKIENARMLTESEYSYNAQLGFISLNQTLDNDEVLGVAFEYTYQGKVYKVGELATDGITGKDALYLKLLKGTSPNPKLPNWDLMMKNVYSIGAYQVDRENFKLNIWYTNPQTNVDINYIPKEGVNRIPLIQLLGMDRIDQNGNQYPDGVFDFVDNAATKGGTINSRNGRIFFPVIEPFGSYLEQQLKDQGIEQNEINSIVFRELYDSTKIVAQQRPEFNRFLLKGTYQSAVGSEISLNALNIPEGSVVVSAGGAKLTENVDYSVDYTLGRVRILNEGLLESQTPISVKLESNSLFTIQTKTFLGTHLNYRINDDFNIGGTVINLRERPLTPKVNFGDDPINNTMVGFDINYRKESKLLTLLIDKLPFLETKEMSEITFSGEYARLIPGHSKLVGKEGISYVDDFEGSQSSIDIRAFSTWQLASTPQGQPDLFPEAELAYPSLSYGYNRSKISWYVIDQTFQINNNNTPAHVRNDPMQSDHFMRVVYEQEVFPNKSIVGPIARIPTLDIAYYPAERGPYNYDKRESTFSRGTESDGSLKDPHTRWAGLMRQLQTNNFEDANIEYIQFWVMDPFNEDYKEGPNAGKLYFNLGNVSEDILKDGVKTFENGFPAEPVPYGSFAGDSLSVWGRIPVDQIITPAFDPDGQDNQDVGLDGLSDQNEKTFFKGFIDTLSGIITNQTALNKVVADPSSDNYMYYQTPEYDNLKSNILERYKNYAGVEGNSPSAEKSNEMTGGKFTNAGGINPTRPTIEDLNLDNNLSTSESYFQYEVDISPQALNPQNVGSNYITDVLKGKAQVKDGVSRDVYWYQFKIPVRSPNKVINGIQDFRSIRFIRMFMKGFSKPLYLRMARLELIRGEWRKYNFSLQSDGEGEQDDPNNTVFNVGAVNSDENGNRSPINYVVPPGIQREANLAAGNVPANLNEQSMVLQVCNLKDGDARGATRNLDLDMRNYKKLKMFVHAEASGEESALLDNDLTVFIRLGTDFSRNYYEYELPLKTTNFGELSPDAIWPQANEIDLDFDKLKNAKKDRPLDFPVIKPFPKKDGERMIYVVGNPNLSDVRSIMIGVRNPNQNDPVRPWKPDDGQPKCAEIWVNELRLGDFIQTGGYAALARANAKLADLGNIAIAGNISTPGFGSIEKKVNERQRETVLQFDASSNIELGKFLPEKSGVKVPMFLSYSEGYKNPQFDPLSPDIPFNEITGDAEYVKKRKTQSQEFTKRRSINFTNVRKEKAPGSKSHFYDVENLSLTYSYNEMFRRDINTEYNTTKNYRGGLGYVFNANPKSIQPFSKIGIIRKSQHLKLIRDFNFYPGIKQFSFQTNVTRSYNESLIRNTTEGAVAFPQVTKNFNWLRNYDLKYDITKSLKFDFSARNNAVIHEPTGRVSKDDSTYQAFKDTVLSSVKNFGETTTYGHDFNVTYDVPLNKLPMLDFISNSSIKYQGAYQWTRAPFAQDSMGHVIENSRTINLNTALSMNTLYKKVGYLKRVNEKYRNGNPRKKKKTNKKDKKSAESTEKKDKDNKEKEKEKDKEGKDGPVVYVVDQIARLAMSLKNVSATYSHTDGTLLPGYAEQTKYLGMNDGFIAPGFLFISGMQDYNLLGEQVRDFKATSAENGWLIKQPYLNTQFANTVKDDISARASLEPIKYLRIDLNANRTTGESLSGYYRWGPDEFGDSTYVTQNPLTTGNFSTSIITIRTAFNKSKDLESSPAFEEFLKIRPIISSRLGKDNINSQGPIGEYADGYGPLSQEVLVQSFYAAYTKTSASSAPTSIFNIIPMPNWRISYNGLSRIELLKKFFQSVSISHAYRSSFSAGGYISNLLYTENNGDPFSRDNAYNFLPEHQLNGVTISEQFSPLFNVDFTLKNNLTGKLEVRKDRSLSLSLANTQITETKGEEYIIGSGYRFANVTLPFVKGGSIKSDLNLRADVSIRNNFTVTRKIEPLNTQVTAGQTIISIRTSADYAISEKLNLRLFFDKVINKPKIPTTFPTSNTNAGIALRFTITS